MYDELSRAIQIINEKHGTHWSENDKKMFAKMIIDGCVNAVRDEWYKVNATISVADERDTAIRVGTKSGLNKAISVIRKTYGENNEIL